MYESPSAGHRLLALISGAVVIVSFFVLVLTFTVQANISRASYYQAAVDDNDSYDRLFTELLVDPAFERGASALLGGVDVPQEEVVASLRMLIDEAYLREQVDTAIEDIVEYIEQDDDSDLRLFIDVTPIVSGVPDVSIDYLVAAMDALPVRQSDSLPDFESDLENIVAVVSGEGTLPTAIPSYPIPASNRLEVALILVEAGGLDLEDPSDAALIDSIGAAIARDDVAGAIKVSAASLLSGLLKNSETFLTSNPYIERRTVAGEPRYYLRPPASVRQRIEHRLEPVRTIQSASDWLLPWSAVVFAASSLAVLVLSLPYLRHGLRWLGLAWLVSAAAVAGAWYFARPWLERETQELAVSQSSSLPASFQALARDIGSSLVDNLGPSVLIPAVGIAVAGVVLVTLSMFTARRSVEAW